MSSKEQGRGNVAAEMFKNVLEQQAHRHGTSTKRLLSRGEKPQFIRAAEKIASEAGTNIESVLERDLDRLRSSTYPSEDCIMPWEVEDFMATGTLPDPRISHVSVCVPCKALVECCHPSAERIEELLEQVRHSIYVASAVAKKASFFERFLRLPVNAR